MKSFPALFLLILVLAFVAQLFLPWWVITPLCFGLAAALNGTGGKAFWAGFLGVGLGWLLLAGWLTIRNDGLLAHRVAQLLPLGGNSWLLVSVTAVVGGLVAGLAALAGAWARQAVAPATSRSQREQGRNFRAGIKRQPLG
ncbi:hypothetical protein J0X19_20360 [Hymenobacter sp. BT186]|uniref:Uncharacterized protein n=1 Tax=Hymenobacter telluris TaxID=2816474 RepID=A0A939JED5_9BACT|nr:hypothetical protein [Hymenobacter telluris]MBO0360325.1 hypothetical protein [Hymenobacter telluris]MBW3376352.1 hypothetical protein [Hymenobacter norwichensis]